MTETNQVDFTQAQYEKLAALYGEKMDKALQEWCNEAIQEIKPKDESTVYNLAFFLALNTFCGSAIQGVPKDCPREKIGETLAKMVKDTAEHHVALLFK